jgi:ABC-type multidrug transport system ATPase subunit
MPRFCRFCGTSLKNPQARFCPACGKQLTPSGPPDPQAPRLNIRVPGQPPQDVPLTQPSVTIGRRSDNDIVISQKYVSGHHGRLEKQGQAWRYVDLGSTNGTFVNGQRLTKQHQLQRGDKVQIGPFKLVYEAEGFKQYVPVGGMRLDGVNLVRVVGRGENQKRILKGIDLSIYPREFVALVGTSGAGKSTLLMALNGFVRAEEGNVLLDGDDLYRHFDLYRTLIGYVPQDDIIHKELTVDSALRYAARLRLPPDTTTQEINARIDEVLRQVEMTGQKDQPITSLSGGQRKRVSIAVELLAEPKLFFLDEPTSGLDPGLDKKMMYTMRQLADGGQTVVLVTHATANITQCDHVCFLSQGRMVYFGPPQEAFQFFNVTTDDYADIYDKLDDPDPQRARIKAAKWEKRFRQSPQYQRYVAERQKQGHRAKPQDGAESTRARPRINPIRQFLVLTRRYMDLVFRDKLLMTVLLAVMPFIGILLLLISESDWLVGDPNYMSQLRAELAAGEQSATYAIVSSSQRLLFMMALAAVLLGLFAAAYEIIKERSVYQRERMVSLRLIPYLSSKIVVLGAFSLVQCFFLLTVVSLKVQLPPEGVLFSAPIEMYISLVIGIIAAIMMGLFISALAPTSDAVIYVVLLALFFQIIFAGVIFDLPDTAGTLSNLTLSRWTMEGLGTSVDVEKLNEDTCTLFQPDPVTETVSVDGWEIDEDWEPVTVVTETEEIDVEVQPGVFETVPISVPKVTENEIVTVTKEVTETETFTPSEQTVKSKQEFQINYERSASHLCWTWVVLVGFALAFGTGTLVVLKRQDVG